MILFIVFIFPSLQLCQSLPPRNVYTNHWAVRIEGGHEEADKLAAKYGYNNLGQVRLSLPVDHFFSVIFLRFVYSVLSVG